MYVVLAIVLTAVVVVVIERKTTRIIALLTQQGVTMSVLSDAVDALLVRVNEDVQHLLDLIGEANARAEAAAANDAAQESELADLRAANEAAVADAQATADRINAIDPVADFPGVEPPAEG